ncbi:hypothetical protein M2171_007778 [Bradyrhizobium japonicum USDA 38]|nr:hypothetical protein [Bradyrhizobium japonicum USDA 38]MCS3941698.1 hypothetical protein [Bradyrhizobium japonicum]MCW2225815.1 hypothetical protein [Bradyrhizobium japonicum]MCW2341026.1 hypothetical protein [Bradyrhizobium japonicum]
MALFKDKRAINRAIESARRRLLLIFEELAPH